MDSMSKPSVKAETYAGFSPDWRAECPCGAHNVTSPEWQWAYEGLVGHLAVSHPRGAA